MLPAVLLEEIAAEVLIVQALHDHDDRAGLLVIEALNDILVEPGVDTVTLRIGRGIRCLERIVDDDQARATAGARRTWPNTAARKSTNPASPISPAPTTKSP
jgi:hypothetical protein